MAGPAVRAAAARRRSTEASDGPLGAATRVPSNVARTRQRPTDGGVNAIEAEPFPPGCERV